jgi:hypothetical protein
MQFFCVNTTTAQCHVENDANSVAHRLSSQPDEWDIYPIGNDESGQPKIAYGSPVSIRDGATLAVIKEVEIMVDGQMIGTAQVKVVAE